jgi:type IV pilus assembly protein PilQ
MITLLATLLLASPPPAGDTRLALDLKDAPVEGIVRALAEIGGLQVVVDPGVTCRLTIKLTSAAVGTAMDAVLRACSLGSEEANGILRVAPLARLAEEAREERRLQEAKDEGGKKTLALIHLSYARAQDLVPLVKKLLAPGGDVSVDPRTNVLIITE